jgi:hypothetical protein
VNQSWGRYDDPDTLQGLAQYEASGLTLRTPSDIQHLGSSDLRSVAYACSALLDSTYKGNYPQSTKDVDALAASMAKGDTLLFMLLDGEKTIAIASLVRRSNGMRGNLQFVELSKAAKLPGEEATAVQVRYLSKYRLMWAAENLPDVNFLYGSPRAAREGRDGAPGGKQAQSVWWGGRQHGAMLPLVTTNVGWNFRVGGIEPLTGFTAPTQASAWLNSASTARVFVPNDRVEYSLRTLLTEGTNGMLSPTFGTTSDAHEDEPVFREARPPSADIVAKYYVTDDASHLVARSAHEVNDQLPGTISQKVIVETDIAAMPHGARVMRWLLANGWTFVGWQPSEVVFGGICPMFARANPELMHELIEPMHHSQYFNNGGLRHTKEVLDAMYKEMRSKALSANAH